MKVVGLIAYVVLLVPIYVFPWLGFGFWLAEAICYALLAAIVLLCSAARWTVALVALAAVFDLLPLLDLVPFVPTVLLVTAFVFVAKAPVPAQRVTE